MSSRRRFSNAFASQLALSVDNKDGALEVIYPGILRDDTNRKGVLRPNQLAKIFESSRFMSLRLLRPLTEISYAGKTIVILRQDITLTPKVHLMTTGRTSVPYKITTKISSAGTSSFILYQSLSRADDNYPLIECHTTLVYVDWISRRPTSLPAQVRDSVPRKEKGGENLKLPEIPLESFSHEVEIQPSDLDSNQHTNQSVYFRICSDTEYAAAAKSFYRGILDVSALHFLEMSNLFTGESTEGDSLTVYTWQDINNIYELNFVIVKESIPIFYSRWKISPRPARLQASL